MTTTAVDTAVRSPRTAPEAHQHPAPSTLERALYVAAARMSAARRGAPTKGVDLETLAELVIEAAIRDQHNLVMSSLDTAGQPTAQESRWAASLSASVAARFQRTARRVLRTLKGESPTPTADAPRDAKGCPAWCVHHDTGTECDWHESKPIAFLGPGDFYLEDPEPVEVLWSVISETPQDAIDDGQKPGTYIGLDTLGDGMVARLDVAGADRVIRDLSRYLLRFQAMRDQLAALTAAQQTH